MMVMGGVEAANGLPWRSMGDCRWANLAGIAGDSGGALFESVMSRNTAEDRDRKSFDTPRFHEPFLSSPVLMSGLNSLPERKAGEEGV
jgi:hypothetical protein